MIPHDRIRGLAHTYEVEGVIGEGGFGITHRASVVGTDDVVVLKQLRLEKIDSWKALELFEREAKALSSLDHPNIPRYVEFFATTDGGPVKPEGDGAHAPQSLMLVQEMVDGTDLAERLRGGESLRPNQVLRIVRTILETLRYLHELSPPVIHRDVNPKNIVVTEDGEPYLVDFGAMQQKLHEQTVGGSTAVGTLGYISMEQSLGKARPASDLYSLAITAVVLTTGMQPEQLPLDDSTGKIDVERLGIGGPADSIERRALRRFLDAALEPVVGRRVASARDALALLDESTALSTSEASALREPTQDETALVKHQPPAWKRTLFILCLGGSLGGAGIIYPLNFNNFSETQMVQMAPFWVLPAAFGFAGLLAMKTERPITNAIIGTVIAALSLVGFFAVIFPAL